MPQITTINEDIYSNPNGLVIAFGDPSVKDVTLGPYDDPTILSSSTLSTWGIPIEGAGWRFTPVRYQGNMQLGVLPAAQMNSDTVIAIIRGKTLGLDESGLVITEELSSDRGGSAGGSVSCVWETQEIQRTNFEIGTFSPRLQFIIYFQPNPDYAVVIHGETDLASDDFMVRALLGC